MVAAAYFNNVDENRDDTEGPLYPATLTATL
jgi:hypothetical protein